MERGTVYEEEESGLFGVVIGVCDVSDCFES